MSTDSDIEQRVLRRTSDLVAANEALRREVAERQSAEATLLESELLFRSFLENAPAAVAMLDREMRYLLVSRRFLTDYGLGDRDIRGLSHYEVFPEIPERWREIHRRVLAGEVLRSEEDWFLREDRRTEWVRWECRPWHDRRGEVGGMLMFTEVITERKQAEEHVRKINRARRALSRCNQALIRARDESEFLQDLCRIIVEVAGYRFCWVGFAEHDAEQTVRPVACAGHEDGYLRVLNVTWADVPRGRGPAGTAVREGRVCVLRNIATDPQFEPWREEALRRGYASVLGVPLQHGGEVFGVLTIYATEPDAFDDEEVALLGELAGDLSYGVVSLRTRSERRQAEEALRASEQKYRQLFEDLGDAAFLIDPVTGRIHKTNKQGEVLLGLSREQIEGMTEADLNQGIDVAPSRLEIGRRPDETYTADYESEVVRSDGTVISVHIREALRAINGDRYILALYRDITDRKRAESALRHAYDELEARVERRTEELSRVNARLLQEIAERERTERELHKSRERFELAVRGSQDGLWDWDIESNVVYFSPRWKSMLGYEDDEIPNRFEEWERRLHPEDRERALAVVRAYLEGKEAIYQLEHRLRHKDGSYRWILARGVALRSEDGKPYRMVGSHMDLTQLKQAEQALRSSELLYRQLTEGTLDAIVVTDQKGTITLFNAAAQKSFGYTEAEVLGRPVSLLMPEEYRVIHEGAIQRYVDTREAHVVGRTVELHGLRKSGETFPMEISLSAIELPNELVFLGAIRDLTERRRMQSRVAQAEKLASLGMLSAGVAHEINNPLAYVANNLAVLERDQQGLSEILDAYEEGRADLARVRPDLARRIEATAQEIDLDYIRKNLSRILESTRQGVKRVSDIVQNLRGFARVDQVSVDRVDLHAAIATSLEMIRGRLQRRNIEVIQPTGDPLRVVCAPAQINQVFLNLLVNAMQAIEATGRDHGRIEIRTFSQDENVVVEVIDDGTGIPKEQLPRLFDPFFTTKPVGQGTGLGLSISHGIVTDHGGRIEVESNPGSGSVFRVILPAEGPGTGLGPSD